MLQRAKRAGSQCHEHPVAQPAKHVVRCAPVVRVLWKDLMQDRPMNRVPVNQSHQDHRGASHDKTYSR